MFANASTGDNDYNHTIGGIRYYFGKQKSLIERHHKDDPPNLLFAGASELARATEEKIRVEEEQARIAAEEEAARIAAQAEADRIAAGETENSGSNSSSGSSSSGSSSGSTPPIAPGEIGPS